MKLKNALLVVKDVERSRRFCHSLFGLEMVQDCELYFEESDIEAFIEKLESRYPDIHTSIG